MAGLRFGSASGSTFISGGTIDLASIDEKSPDISHFPFDKPALVSLSGFTSIPPLVPLMAATTVGVLKLFSPALPSYSGSSPIF